MSGDWHEGSANWLTNQVVDAFDPSLALNNSWFPLPHGRDYYGNTIFMETVLEEPNMGPTFINTFYETGQNDYIMNAMAKQVSYTPDGYNAVKNVLGRMAAKCVNFDYKRGDYIRNSGYENRLRYVYPAKEAGSSTWLRVPWEQAPSQGGFNVIPLSASAGATVTVNFKGVWDVFRGSDWRACLVAVSSNGDSRYSSFWNTGTNSIKLSSNETLYLTVACTPEFMQHDFNRDIQYSMEKEPQAYEISLTNATVAEPTNGSRGTGWHQHSNGGGWVQDTATVDATAYVGPNAIVQDTAQVRNNARIEDYAQIGWAAQVRDNAVVSGHAIVWDGAQVYGYAKVRDWGKVQNSAVVYGNARILEHGTIQDGVTVCDNACVRGYAWWYGTVTLNGYAIADGDAADGSNLDHGTSTGWSWGPNQSYNDNLPDTGGIFCQYSFESISKVYAKDTYGMSWGYLVNSPATVLIGDSYRNMSLQFDGTSQYIECPRSLNDIKDTAIMVRVKWTGSANDQRIFSFGDGSSKYMYLTPKDTSTGKVRFVITDGTTTQYLDGAAAITANRWTHIAISFSGNTAVLYVDGTAVDTDNAFTLNPDDLNSANTVAASNCNYIGKGNAGNYFVGYMDDFRVYSLTKDATFISGVAAQFVDRNAGPASGSVPNPSMLWYKFDETSGSTATDSSGAGKNGTTVNSPTWVAGKINNCLNFNGTNQ